MDFPSFFAQVPRIRLRDPLAEFLGATGGGLLEYGYADAVRLAGHSCPTVAAAYGMARRGLGALYGARLPERGGVRVEFRAARLEGATGVIANVLSLITGATFDSGFKGFGGVFDRRQLLFFGAPIEGQLRLTRVDNGEAVQVSARLGEVPADPSVGVLLQRCLAGDAGADVLQRFRQGWQDRVRRILIDHGDDPVVFPVAAD